ncbi:hypothetical protein BDV29DRAFT_176025 [Aspergillus leporis]|uniref:Uncharacterized protein n=1 Tax=Aspergillus leporis TaxID=41062 RepID=A0A5N5WZK6_9EURO|nr:hypothetical protein BDV29DRAFT_176025 [Aspergillus leporis]
MDLQGTPTGHVSSTKVTTDPEASRNPIQESSGPVAGDSLAAESANKGGTYSQNRGAQPLGVSGSKSTLNTKDTSAASELPPAPTGAARENARQGTQQGTRQSARLQQQQQSTFQNQQRGTANASGSGYTSKHNAGAAPSYVKDVVGDFGNKKPHGKNLQEGGFDDTNNASFNTEIGSENDPGRLAERGSQQKQTESGPTGTSAGREKGVNDQQYYQHLQSDQRA